METEERNQRACKASEPEFFLQWGNKKRLRCVRVKGPDVSERFGGRMRRKITSSRIDRCLVTASEKEVSHHLQPNRLTSESSKLGSYLSSDFDFSRISSKKNSEGATLRSGAADNRKSSSSPEKEDRCYTTRGSVGLDENGNGKVSGDGNGNREERGAVWPKLYISLSSKEKEEDFMAMKGCKLPQRPKKRAKIVQRSLLLVSPGAWLTDMCQERYEVREKKSSKKRPRGLKAMGSMESDSE